MNLRPSIRSAAQLILLCMSISIYGPCQSAEFPAAHLDPSRRPARSLNDYHFFLDTKNQIPNAGVIPFDLNTPHFADYAHLRRFLWLPAGTHITYQANGELHYPVGAVLIITVGYLHDLRHPDLGEDVIETRLLVRREQGWQSVQYNWNDEKNDATLSVVGTRKEVSWIHYDGGKRSHTYLAPNSNQCKQCHQINEQFVPLGPTSADRINREFGYPDGRENQLARWSKLGYLVGAPKNVNEVPQMAVWDDPSTGSVHDRAQAYLEMNCSSCHRPNGIAYTSGLDLTFEQPFPVRYGVFKAPVAAGRGVGNGRFAIEPGRPDRSFLVHRIKSTDPGVRMPIVGRGLVHEEGVALIEEWISQMQFAKLAQAQSKADQQSVFRTVRSDDSTQNASSPSAVETQ